LLFRALARLRRNGPVVMAAGLVVGLAVPPLAALLRPTLPALVFLLTVATFLSVEWPEVCRHARRPGLLAIIAVTVLLVTPIIAALVARLAGLPPGLAQGLVLWSASPPLASVPAIAMLLGLDGALALVAMLVGTFLMPFTLPPLVLGLIGFELGIGLVALMMRLVVFIGAASLAAKVLHRAVGAARLRRRADALGGVNVMLLHLFAIAVMDGVGELIRADASLVLLYAATAFAANLGFQALGFVAVRGAFRGLDRADAATMALAIGNRNMGVVYANLGGAATPELTLFFVAVQLPIYAVPLVLRSVYRRLVAPSGARLTP
jgi:predicted Na+-dependent transporter